MPSPLKASCCGRQGRRFATSRLLETPDRGRYLDWPRNRRCRQCGPSLARDPLAWNSRSASRNGERRRSHGYQGGERFLEELPPRLPDRRISSGQIRWGDGPWPAVIAIPCRDGAGHFGDMRGMSGFSMTSKPTLATFSTYFRRSALHPCS
jgi:hypothetical protein